jgi:hypothetical protein
MARHGRSNDEWDLLVNAGHDLLIEVARSKGMTSYTKLSNKLAEETGARRFDFDQPSERAAIGELLGLIVERDLPVSRAMISALVLYSDGTDAGPGFYKLAKELDLLPAGSSKLECTKFWVDQVQGVYDHYAITRA